MESNSYLKSLQDDYAARMKNLEAETQVFGNSNLGNSNSAPAPKISFAEDFRGVNKDAWSDDGEVNRSITEPVETLIANQSTIPITKCSSTFAAVLHNKAPKKVVKISELKNEEIVDGAAVAIPLDAVEEVSSRFENTLYGYFIGKRLAFRLVENYVKNTWSKYGLKRIQLHDEFFLFQFDTKEGMEGVLESGPSTYARALIEVKADSELKDSIVIAILIGKDKGHTLATIDIEYEWKPPRRVEKGDASKTNENKVMPKDTIQPKPKVSDPKLSVKLHNSFSSLGDGEDAEELPNVGETSLPVKGFLMINIASWNIRGLNFSPKQNEVRQDDQAIHTRVWLKAEKKELFYSFIYAHNRYTHCRALWKSLNLHKSNVRDRPWCLMGDFNVALFLNDTLVGSSHIDISMREFKECVADIEVANVQQSGLQFTWNQKPKGTAGILKKLDRVMVNLALNDAFVGAHAIFKPYRVSDHSPSMLNIPTLAKSKPKPFKFYNLLTRNEKFYDVVNSVWNQQNELDFVQTLLDKDLYNPSLREAKATYVIDFNEAVILEERFLMQNAKINWLKEGDSNSAYFYKAVKSRVSRSRIDAVTNSDGVVFENDLVADAFVTHYETFLGQVGVTHGFNPTDLFNKCLDEQVALDMVRMVSRQEVKEAMFSMGNDKAPSPDGYTAAFYNEAWDLVANDVTDAVCFGFHARMMSWIMECVTTTSYSISINGSLNGYFKGRRGLRQGDPLSPYLFTLVMEMLTLMLRRRVLESHDFVYHRYCSKLELINLCFADDLFLFAHGNVSSVRVIKESLEEFKNASSLVPSLPKKGQLPVKYLGVPLVSSRILVRDCKELIEKIQIWVQDWKNKSLSIASRLQLVNSVIGSMHTFWSSVFILPSCVLLDIKQIMRGFFWCQGSMRKGRAKVAWEAVCLPKKEGGLGIRRLEQFNSALMVSHIWKLLSLKESL
ncbi:hypothetical protein Tco_1192231 [Tanacetum coccineum]